MSSARRRSPGAPLRGAAVIRRAAALLLAVVWSAAPGLAALHAQAEQHRYCVQHQALEEASSAAPVAEGRAAGPLAEGVPPAPPGAHEACAFGHLWRFDRSLAPVVLAIGPALAAPAVSIPTGALTAPVVALYRLAPKTSPPA